MIRLFALCSVLLLASCGVVRGVPGDDVRLVAVGDSILAWNRDLGQDVPQLVSDRTGLPVFNGAISGARFQGLIPIPPQYPSGPWDWVMMTGGGNDLFFVCDEPGPAGEVLDRLISPTDLSGDYLNLINRARADGAQVIIMGYAPISTMGGPFAPCEDALDRLAERQAMLAAAFPDVHYVDIKEVIAPDNLAAFDPDWIHPSPAGGALMADAVAAVISNSTR